MLKLFSSYRELTKKAVDHNSLSFLVRDKKTGKVVYLCYLFVSTVLED